MRWSEHDGGEVPVFDSETKSAVGVAIPLVFERPVVRGWPDNPEPAPEPERVGCLRAFDTDEGWVEQVNADGTTTRRTGSFYVVFMYEPYAATP
jgi:hypothetical protein